MEDTSEEDMSDEEIQEDRRQEVKVVSEENRVEEKEECHREINRKSKHVDSPPEEKKSWRKWKKKNAISREEIMETKEEQKQEQEIPVPVSHQKVLK